MRGLLHRRIGTAAWLACAALFAWCATAWSAPPPTEHQLKAVYLFNFGQFVEWPSQAWESADAPIVIGILGEDPVREALETVVRGESLRGHAFAVRRFATAAQIDHCHILYIGKSGAGQLGAALDAMRGRSVLTVTDIDGAERHGAVIVLFSENNRIRMRINVAAAKAGSLVISSKLLRPAVIVDGGD